MISIVIPLYNKEKQIANTLQTVFNQTFQDFEIVIVDDGSTDKGVEEVQKINDSHIRLIHQENQGVSATRNRGIAESKYDYVAFLDADDEWKPEYLQTQYELIQKYAECDVFVCNYEFKNETGKITSTIINKLPFNETEGILGNYFEVASCSHPPLWTSAVVVKKDAVQAIGGFPVGTKAGEDLLTWARLAVNYKIAYNKKPLASFVLDNSTFKPRRNPAEKDVVGEKLKKLYQNYPRIKSLRQYVSLWHKMRASIYLRLNERKKALREILIAMRFNLVNCKLWIYLGLVLMPSSVIHKFLK
jgi:glycosyltransferase involved in cell wall biosynthesis